MAMLDVGLDIREPLLGVMGVVVARFASELELDLSRTTVVCHGLWTLI